MFIAGVNCYLLVFSDVIRSAIGAVLWLAVIIAWIVIFQVNRAAWGATADSMSFIIPKGIP